MKPVYAHHCQRCVYLGTHIYQSAKYDLYYDPQPESVFPTVLARHGNDTWEYESGLLSAIQDLVDGATRPLAVALRLAVRSGHLKLAATRANTS